MQNIILSMTVMFEPPNSQQGTTFMLVKKKYDNLHLGSQ